MKIASLTMASHFFEDTLRGHAIFLLTGKGRYDCLDAPKRNSNGNANASKGSEATQALLYSEIHSEVYNTDERARLQAHAMLHVDEIAQCGGCTTLLLPLMGRYRVDGAR